MIAYLVKRGVQTVITLIAVITLIFILFRLAPADPTMSVIGPGMDPAVQEEMTERFGLNQPIHDQYISYVAEFLKGNMGHSFTQNQAVSDILIARVPNTLILMGTSILLAYAIGMLLGAWGAWKHNSSYDNILFIGAILFRSIPAFLIGLLLLYVFSFGLEWFPRGHMADPYTTYDSRIDLFLSPDFLYHLFLPAVSLIPFSLGFALLLMRTTALDVVNEEFMTICKAKGLSERSIFTKHLMRNSLLPMLTVMPFMLGMAITGNILIETIFSWPGIGRTLVEALLIGDYPLAQGAFFLIAIIVIVGNFLVDLLYTQLDPRIKYD